MVSVQIGKHNKQNLSNFKKNISSERSKRMLLSKALAPSNSKTCSTQAPKT